MAFATAVSPLPCRNFPARPRVSTFTVSSAAPPEERYGFDPPWGTVGVGGLAAGCAFGGAEEAAPRSAPVGTGFGVLGWAVCAGPVFAGATEADLLPSASAVGEDAGTAGAFAGAEGAAAVPPAFVGGVEAD